MNNTLSVDNITPIEVAFISGATGGIGKAFAKQVAKSGFNLFLTGRSLEKLEKLSKEISSEYGVKTDYFACDLTNESAVNHLIGYIKERGYKINKIINVAGIDTQKAFTLFTQEKLARMVKLNALSTISLTHALIEKRAENLEILTVASMSGASPMPYFALYSATKSLLINLFTSLHYELKGLGVKVTVVMPGGVYTRADVIEQINGQGLWGKLSAKSPEFVAKRSLRAVSKNKVKYIPGFFNKFLYFIMQIAPKRLVLKFIARRWSKIEKDAF